MAFEITGKLVEKYETQSVSEKFKKREFVVEYRDNPNSSFTEFLKFQLTQDRCNLIDNYQIGQDVRVAFNLRGRRWEKDGAVSYFSNLEAWKIESASVQSGSPAPSGSLPDVSTSGSADVTNDLPF
ncbi:MAG: hypothetical protein CVT94_17735 [Bacteroidetes bacterium HGW-Bacteroidetes-11]|jgi:hypothetical protein|nr:MAG: hypothetical protein CVT94_17735 [Bacteroidetes bacterium HGW-Bacteroidetes-11]